MILNPMKNPEGYLDMTAYLAIYKGGDEDMVRWFDGDIFKSKKFDGKYAYKVILKMHDNYATTLFLFDNESHENEYATEADGTKHADLGKIGYTKMDDLEYSQFVRHMEPEELVELKRRVSVCLGAMYASDPEDGDGGFDYSEELSRLKSKEQAADAHWKFYKEKYSEAKEQIEELKNQVSKLKDAPVEKIITEQPAVASADLARACAERDVYEKLYYDLLTRCGFGIQGGPIVSFTKTGT